jgi:hypothetical protein
MMSARSAVRLAGDTVFRVTASSDSTGPINEIRVRNRFANINRRLVVVGLIAEARGDAATADASLAVLAPAAAPFFQVLATAANAAVDEPGEFVAYAPPTRRREGEFIQQRQYVSPLAASTVRSIGGVDFNEVVAALHEHPDHERLQRAMAHYRSALSARVPFNRLMSAEHLYIAAENLSQVVFRRKCREAGLSVSDDRRQMGENKHSLAEAAGFKPRSGGNQHLNGYDSHLRRTEIFDGDGDVYKGLRDASDGFEHGYASFGTIQASADSLSDKAFRCIRRAILRELGLSDGAGVLAPKFDHPLEGWQPVIQFSGTYRGDATQGWPYFYGANPFVEVTDIEDASDDHRTLTFNIMGDGDSLLEGQALTIRGATLSLPLTPDRQVAIGDHDIVVSTASTS